VSLTVEALAQEITRLDTLSPDIEWAPEALATILLPFIERHIAAGLQGAGCGACGDGCKDRGSCRLADESPKPAGAVPLPEADGCLIADGEQLVFSKTRPVGVLARDVYGRTKLHRYGDAREAAGRADAVPAWFCELPAPISNPEAWPANYAGGYNDALNMCYDVIRGHAPQPMTTQGEAVATVVESLANGHALEFHGGYSETLDALPIGTKLYTGSQP